MIEWNDGLSIGVKVLDDDHKKLLEIINKLSIAIDDNLEKEVLESIFVDLEEYTIMHFKREESFIARCDYKYFEEHKDEHKGFAAKIPELKAKLLSSKDYINTQDVSVFLTDWLINHIVTEDIPLINVFQECGIIENKVDKTSFLEKLIKKTTDTISYSKRILFLTLIPLFGMLFLGYIILYNDYIRYENIKTTSNITHILSNVNELVHNIQIERGLCTGHLTSQQNKYEESLHYQHSIVDKIIKSFNTKLGTIDKDSIFSVKTHLDTFKEDAKILYTLRKEVHERTISHKDAINKYTKIINNILGITSKVASFNLDKQIHSSIATLSSILYFKEELGKERAFGTIIIEKKDINIEEYVNFIQILGARESLSNSVKYTATESQKKSFDTHLDSNIAKKVLEYEMNIIYGDFKEFDSKTWFEIISKHIDNIKLLQEQLLYETSELIHNQINSAINNLILWILFFTIILSGTIFIIYIFEMSSKKQIHNFTDAMKHIAHGGRSLRLETITTKDEIADMYDAYEVTRQKLLKADIFTQLYLSQKAVELKGQQIKNLTLEKIAFIDPLTGAINRRKFEELSMLELKRSTRYKHNLSFLLIDIDHFKQVNDTYGHSAGDEILQRFTSICKDMARNLDVVARIGGEEFVIMLPETEEEGAFVFAERLRKMVWESIFIIDAKEIQFSVSIGIALLDISIVQDVKTVLQKADKALYEAKNSGRNKTVIYKKMNNL